jgi:hypothetical protein
MLPGAAFAAFASRFRAPKLDEGFQDIVKINFVVRGFFFSSHLLLSSILFFFFFAFSSCGGLDSLPIASRQAWLRAWTKAKRKKQGTEKKKKITSLFLSKS